MKSDRGVLRQVIFDRRLLWIIYGFITIAAGIQVILDRSVGIGAGALVACAICLIASCTLISCFLARHEQPYSAKDLGIIAVIAVSLTFVGLAFMRWSGFRLTLYGVEISGIQWALVGSVVGVITAKKELLKSEASDAGEKFADGKTGTIIADDKLLSASRWRSISEIPNFPFKSFGDMQQAVADRRCYLSVDSSMAYRFADLFNGPGAQVLDGLLSWVPGLVAIASVIAAVFFRDAWLLIGVPAAVLGYIVGASVHHLWRSILTRATGSRDLRLGWDPAIPFPLRFAARILLAVMSSGGLIGVLLFGGLLLSAHTTAAWIVASYLVSAYAIRSYLARNVAALNFAAIRSEPFFLFALSRGLCGLRDNATDEFIVAPRK